MGDNFDFFVHHLGVIATRSYFSSTTRPRCRRLLWVVMPVGQAHGFNLETGIKVQSLLLKIIPNLMSKAFTRETNDDPDDELEPEEQLAPKGSKNYITPAGFANLQAQLKDLFNVQRPETVKVVSWAAALGDRSENADYLYGKKRLREIDKRIRFLTKRIGYAEIVDPTQQPKDKIFFGATVVVSDEASEEHTYSIVGMDEIDLSRGRVSWISPVAKALLGKQVGDTVVVHTPGGAQELEVIEIRYEAITD